MHLGHYGDEYFQKNNPRPALKYLYHNSHIKQTILDRELTGKLKRVQARLREQDALAERDRKLAIELREERALVRNERQAILSRLRLVQEDLDAVCVCVSICPWRFGRAQAGRHLAFLNDVDKVSPFSDTFP